MTDSIQRPGHQWSSWASACLKRPRGRVLASGLVRRGGGGELGPHEHEWRVGVPRLGERARAEGGDDSGLEHEAVRGSAELGVSEVGALGHVMPGRDLRVDEARGDLDHADGDDGHQTHGRVDRFDKDDRAGGDVGDVALRGGGVDGVPAFAVGFGVVGAVLDEGAHDGPCDWAVPAVVVRGAEEGLVHGSPDEARGGVVAGQHVIATSSRTVLARHRREPDGAGVMVRDTVHVTALETAVLAAFTTGKPCHLKARRPPTTAALAQAEHLRSNGSSRHDNRDNDDVVVDLQRGADAAQTRRVAP